jgi:hypothetical protein
MHKEISKYNQDVGFELRLIVERTGKLVNQPIENFQDLYDYYNYAKNHESIFQDLENKFPTPSKTNSLQIQAIRLNIKKLSKKYESKRDEEIETYKSLIEIAKDAPNKKETFELLEKILIGQYPEDEKLIPIYNDLQSRKAALNFQLKQPKLG